MKTNHAPGPWNVTLIREDRQGWRLSEDAYKDWPAAIAYKIKDETLEIGCDEAEANARLITSAPDLLAALRDLLDDHDKIPAQYITEQGHQRADEARAAIAKAEGK